ncbi:MAG: SPASM domain-containing protein [Acidobacteriota bacterium]|jgi:MoaA/NifB/PqqE/SkfB family radical SAM enzyme|nr:SPASM domain-containing protein [Acidobacteriota bacterium]
MTKDFVTHINNDGCLVLPPELAREFGLVPGARIRIESNTNKLTLLRPVTQLAKVYIEPTNRCNLDCVTCIRHSWNEPLGTMSSETFSRIIEGLRSIDPPPDIFFGGLGEPLSHPNILDMVREAKALGSKVELISNGTLLSKDVSTELVAAGLDKIWISLDGATPESYTDVRLGAALPEVLKNLQDLRQARWLRYRPETFDLLLKPQIGIVFVAMKRNIADLPAVLSLATRLGSLHFMVTNVLPYTPEMQEEILYSRAVTDSIYISAPLLRSLDFPKMDVSPATREALYQAMRGDHYLSISGAGFGERNNRCPFIDKGSVAIRWDGEVSPCLALMHDHRIYLYKYERAIKRHSVGNVRDQSIDQIWNKPEYLTLRSRLQEFNFSPCLMCGGCELFESNQEDCIGSPAPACGGCLWAQGIIQCP